MKLRIKKEAQVVQIEYQADYHSKPVTVTLSTKEAEILVDLLKTVISPTTTKFDMQVDH